MRIRRCASRILGLTHTSVAPEPTPLFEEVPLPQPPPPAPAARESHAWSTGFTYPTSSAENCELSRSPWDLISELDRFDPQEEKKLVESYFVHVIGRVSWLFPTCLLAATSVEENKPAIAVVNEVSVQPSYEVAKKLPVNNKVGMKSKPKHKEKDHGNGGAIGVAQGLTTCKKSDGKSWLCGRPVCQPRSKKRRRKSADAGEGFYYYTGFGPFRTKKRHCRSSSRMHESAAAEQDQEEAPAPQDVMPESARGEQAEDQPEDITHEPAPPEQKQDLPEDTTLEQPAPPEQEQLALPEDCAAPIGEQAQADDADPHQAAAQHDRSRREDIAGIAGIDEESSSDNAYCYNGKGKTRVIGVNGESKRKGPWKKRRRKPIKARSLKSLISGL